MFIDNIYIYIFTIDLVALGIKKTTILIKNLCIGKNKDGYDTKYSK